MVEAAIGPLGAHGQDEFAEPSRAVGVADDERQAPEPGHEGFDEGVFGGDGGLAEAAAAAEEEPAEDRDVLAPGEFGVAVGAAALWADEVEAQGDAVDEDVGE